MNGTAALLVLATLLTATDFAQATSADYGIDHCGTGPGDLVNATIILKPDSPAVGAGAGVCDRIVTGAGVHFLVIVP